MTRRPADAAREILRNRRSTTPTFPPPHPPDVIKRPPPVTEPTPKADQTMKQPKKVRQPSKTYQYKGYEMRSIAEARWAAFFDLCNIRWQYEPISTGDYIPDFLLFGDDQTLVEIKGGATTLTQLEEQTSYVYEKLRGHWHGDILFLGAHPILEPGSFGYVSGLIIEEGWYPTEEGEDPFLQPAEATTCFQSHHPGDPTTHFGWTPAYGLYRLRPWGCSDGGNPEWPKEDIESKWAEATNTVRYLHGGNRK